VTLFPGALTELIRHALAKQVVVARETVEKLGSSLFEPAFRAVQVTLLGPVIAKGESVLDERKAAELDRVEGRLEIYRITDDIERLPGCRPPGVRGGSVKRDRLYGPVHEDQIPSVSLRIPSSSSTSKKSTTRS
jgi:hypothetical protein